MPWFDYNVLTPGGTVMTGRLEAVAHDAALAQLQAMSLQVRELTEAQAPPRTVTRISADDLAFFNEQLASMAQAGMALDDGLAQLARDIESPALRKWIEALVADLRRGVPLEQAVADHEQGLPLLYSRVIRAGVQTGDLPATLMNLNQHLHFTATTRRLLWETLSYPLVVIVMALGIVTLFFGFLMPQFKEVFAEFDSELPALTQGLLLISDHVGAVGLVLLALIAAGVGFGFASRYFAGGRALREHVLDLIPVVGRVHRASLLARFCRSVATAVGSGLGLAESLRLGAGATGSPSLIRDAEHMAGQVERGHSALSAAETTPHIPALFGYCVQVSGMRGALPAALAKLAHAYESRARHVQTMLRILLMPITILLLGAIVGLGIAGMFLPLLSLIQSMTG